MVQILGKMEANIILYGLKKISEGEFYPEEWINWWNQNENSIKLVLSPRWYLKIKPKMSQGIAGATLISQNNAREYLKSIKLSFNETSHINYSEEWKQQINDISIKYNDADFDSNFTLLKRIYPNLFAAIKKHLQKYDIIENNLTNEKLASSPFYKLLHSNIIVFFNCISRLRMEGVNIAFNMLEQRDEYIKIGELWLNNDGDELYIKPNEETIYFHDIGNNNISIINKSIKLFAEKELSAFIS